MITFEGLREKFMYHQTLEKLLRYTDNVEFERLMCDLLSGKYKSIDPQSPGVADGGKDAFYYDKQEKIWFAFSLRKDWKQKFNEDFAKAPKSRLPLTSFIFCINQLLPALERDKIKKTYPEIQIDFYDGERIRVMLDGNYKNLRQIYLGIQDNTTIRRKIKNLLFDPQNEAVYGDRWKAINLTATLDQIGLFDLIKDQDLSSICETQDEFDLLTDYISSFMVFRKVATDIDNSVMAIVQKQMSPTNSSVGYWNKISEYCKLRLFGADKNTLETRIKTWSIASDFSDCERVYDFVVKDEAVEALNYKIGPIQKKCKELMDKIRVLKGFSFEAEL